MTIAVDSSLGATSAFNFFVHLETQPPRSPSIHLVLVHLHPRWCNWICCRFKWHRNHRIHIHYCEFFDDYRSRLIVYFFRLRWGPPGPLFLSLPILLRWPDELDCIQSQFHGTDRIAAMWRCDQFHDAELEILLRLADHPNDFDCLILVSLR